MKHEDNVKLNTLKKNAKIIYDLVDKDIIKKNKKIYKFYDDGMAELMFEEFLNNVDGIISSSPTQREDYRHLNKPIKLIEHPVINDCFKKKYDTNIIKIVWQGFSENKKPMNKIEPIIKKIIDEEKVPLELIYHTNMPNKKDGFIRYIEWSVKNAFSVLAESDIALTIKEIDNPCQKRKPSTKVIAYMAAGLPIICTPTVADQLVVNDGKNGFLAYNEDDWYKYLKRLINDAKLREQVGRRARKNVLSHYSVPVITKKYLDFFDEIMK